MLTFSHLASDERNPFKCLLYTSCQNVSCSYVKSLIPHDSVVSFKDFTEKHPIAAVVSKSCNHTVGV